VHVILQVTKISFRHWQGRRRLFRHPRTADDITPSQVQAQQIRPLGGRLSLSDAGYASDGLAVAAMLGVWRAPDLPRGLPMSSVLSQRIVPSLSELCPVLKAQASGLKLTAAFHSGGHVELCWTIRPWITRYGWEAPVTTWIEGGQQMTELAAAVRAFLTHAPPVQLRRRACHTDSGLLRPGPH